jgi:hypothetical protein
VLGRDSIRARNPLLAFLVGAALFAVLQIAGKLIGLVGFVLFHPIAIALGIAAGALAVILTIAGFGAMVITRFASGPRGEGAIGSQWWPPGKGPFVAGVVGVAGKDIHFGTTGAAEQAAEAAKEAAGAAESAAAAVEEALGGDPHPKGGKGAAAPPSQARPPGAPPDGSSDAP